ncbi:hypothetical protein BZA05DRAFT_22533 [Tricharina praecox]|uniref:uncharacterized protein n=1 Tax=Tricharina praecox TaxID=43433 RepID=UPI00221E44B5|nr:uncharacterized protein BZA05DRAFT_22533 [Tricharina praecox]KAI5859150.1 hypothetical protein BZA05DRAFT_22533 [Tricharina praecox]
MHAHFALSRLRLARMTPSSNISSSDMRTKGLQWSCAISARSIVEEQMGQRRRANTPSIRQSRWNRWLQLCNRWISGASSIVVLQLSQRRFWRESEVVTGGIVGWGSCSLVGGREERRVVVCGCFCICVCPIEVGGRWAFCTLYILEPDGEEGAFVLLLSSWCGARDA